VVAFGGAEREAGTSFCRIDEKGGVRVETNSNIGRLLALLLPPAFALYGTFNGVQQIVLPLQVERIDPSRKVGDLALIVTVCSIASILGLASGGALSDATRSRWGRRTPWLAGMAVASSALLVVLAHETSLIAIVAVSAILWFALNAFQAVLLAVTPDRVPLSRRAMASWIFGFAGPVGALIGINMCAFASLEAGYAALAGFLLLATAVFVVFAPEGPYSPSGADSSVRPKRSLRHAAARFAESFSSPDFALVFIARALLFLAQFTVMGYLLYALQDYVGEPALPDHSPQVAAGLVNTIRTAASIGALLLTGWLMQLINRRKLFLQVYAGATAVALLAPIVSSTWTGMVIFSVLSGAAYGIFASVDLAIISTVLPARASAGRDIGLLAVAGAAPQLLAPALGGLIIHSFGYAMLFAFGAIVTLFVGGVSAFIRSLE
jgi:MFS family permease